MEIKRIVVVGGSAGGMSFATRYRRLNQSDHIIVLEKGPYVSYANCGLPYYISGEISERDDLFVADQDMLQNRFQLDIRPHHEVVNIDGERNVVSVLVDGEKSDIAYDTLVLSTGAKPVDLKIPGSECHPHFYTLRNIPDVDKIVAGVSSESVNHALVIGAGFIGLEVAENLRHKGLHVTLVEKSAQVLPPLDEEMAKMAEMCLLTHGVDVKLNTSVSSFEGVYAVLSDGSRIQADLVISSVGVQPDTDYVKQSGIKRGMRGGFVVDETYQTNLKHVYAIGDAMITTHAISGEDTLIPLASPANRQGRHLADILSGRTKKRRPTLGTSIIRLFDLTLATTGLNEKQCSGSTIEVVHVTANDHAGYFPGATPIVLKVIFDPSTRKILGAQGVGAQGVDKRIDIIATAITADYDVDALQELELSYAPPYGSAKDIVNMVGYIAENILTGTTRRVHLNDVEGMQEKGACLVDVRNDDERNTLGYIQGSIHMPLDTLRCQLTQLPHDRPIIVHCQSSHRSYNAECILRDAGFDVYNMDGSFSMYHLVRPDRIVHETQS